MITKFGELSRQESDRFTHNFLAGTLGAVASLPHVRMVASGLEKLRGNSIRSSPRNRGLRAASAFSKFAIPALAAAGTAKLSDMVHDRLK